MDSMVQQASEMPVVGWVALGGFFAFLVWKVFIQKKSSGGTGGAGGGSGDGPPKRKH